MIRTGRPVFHIKARWISFDGPDGIEFYSLDSKGNLIKKDGKVKFELQKKDINSTPKKEENTESNNIDEGTHIFDSYPDFTAEQIDLNFDDDIFSLPLDDFNFDCFL